MALAALLIIAGAGSGKTNTLAHRVAHLIVKGADPRRILLMTFSRRAASEMTRRVERIAARVLACGPNANSGSPMRPRARSASRIAACTSSSSPWATATNGTSNSAACRARSPTSLPPADSATTRNRSG